MSSRNKEEAIRCQVDFMEKEIVYLKGRRRLKARIAYFRLLHSCGKLCELDESIYLVRS